MKHSSPVKFPTSFLITISAFCLLALIAVSWYIISSWQKGSSPIDGQTGQAVTQLDRAQFDQVVELLNNKTNK